MKSKKIYIYIYTSWGFSVAKEEAHVSRLMLKCAEGVRYFLSFLLSFLALIYVGCFRKFVVTWPDKQTSLFIIIIIIIIIIMDKV